jgi:hypothetical protein
VQLKIVLKEQTPSRTSDRQSPNFVQRDIGTPNRVAIFLHWNFTSHLVSYPKGIASPRARGQKGPPTSDRHALMCSRRKRNLSSSIRKTELSKFEKHSTERDEPG